jgi:tetratricopeptide (TPR) repeat protein
MEVSKFVHDRLLDPSLGLGNPIAGDLVDWVRGLLPGKVDDLLGDIWSKRDRIEGYLWLVVGKTGAYRIKCRWAIEDYLSGQVEQAEMHLMRAKWDLNEWALAHYLLGLMYLGVGRYHESLIELEQAMRFEPYDKERIQSALELVERTASAQQHS